MSNKVAEVVGQLSDMLFQLERANQLFGPHAVGICRQLQIDVQIAYYRYLTVECSQ